MITTKKYVTGPLQVNTTLVYNDRTVLVIDPGADIVPHIKKLSLFASFYVLLTHGHIDHLAGVPSILDSYPSARIVINSKDLPLVQTIDHQARYLGFLPVPGFTPEILIQNDGKINAGDIEVTCLEIGGHTAGSTVFIIDDVIYSGDTLFNYAVGRTDLMGSTTHQELIDNIKNKLMVFPDETRVIPGHGPATTIGFERRENLYVGSRDNS